jgi:hypothetical protein
MGTSVITHIYCLIAFVILFAFDILVLLLSIFIINYKEENFLLEELIF